MSVFCIVAACFFWGIALTCAVIILFAFIKKISLGKRWASKKEASQTDKADAVNPKEDAAAIVQTSAKHAKKIRAPMSVHNRFIEFCITLSASIIAGVFALMFLTSRNEIILDRTTLVYFAFFVLLGALAGKWHRIVISSLVLLYFVYSLFGVLSLLQVFPHPQYANFSVQINAASVTANSLEYSGVVGESSLVFGSYSIPAYWLLPFPLRVIRFAGVVSTEHPDVFLQPQVASSARAFAKEGSPLAVARAESRNFFSIMRMPLFADVLVASREETRLDIPAQPILPMFYSANGLVRRGKPVFTLTRVF